MKERKNENDASVLYEDTNKSLHQHESDGRGIKGDSGESFTYFNKLVQRLGLCYCLFTFEKLVVMNRTGQKQTAAGILLM